MHDRFVTFEGGEGAGKSTQIARLVARLRGCGERVLMTREPGGSPLAERLRAFLLSPDRPPLQAEHEALLFAAARSDHLAKVIRPALERGDVVLCDRFADSTRAYQGQAAGEDLLATLYQESVGVDGPGLTLIFDIDPVVGLARASARRGKDAVDRFEREDFHFHVALRRRFLDIAAAEPERCVVVDASADPDTVEEQVFDAVARRLAIVPTDRAGNAPTR